MRVLPELFILAISVSGVMFSLVSIAVLRKLSQSGETISAKLKLQPERTATDFSILTSANALLFLAMFIYTLAGLTENIRVLQSVEMLLVPVSIPPTLVFIDIWRRMN